jgi:hypothetical protein
LNIDLRYFNSKLPELCLSPDSVDTLCIHRELARQNKLIFLRLIGVMLDLFSSTLLGAINNPAKNKHNG